MTTPFCGKYCCAAFLALWPVMAMAQSSQQSSNDSQGENQLRQAINQSELDASKSELINYLTAKMIMTNDAMIEFSQFAEQRASNKNVQRLAQLIAWDHDQMNQALRSKMPSVAQQAELPQRARQRSADEGQQQVSQGQTASQNQRRGLDFVTVDSPEDSQSTNRDRSSGNRDRSSEDSPQTSDSLSAEEQLAVDGAARDLLQIMRRATVNHLQMNIDMLESYDGGEFDMAFVGQQIASHTRELAELRAISAVGPEELRKKTQKAEQIVSKHLELARRLAKDLADREQFNR